MVFDLLFNNCEGKLHPDPTDLFMSRSLIWSSSTKGVPPFFLVFPLVSRSWDSWRLVILMETMERIQYLASAMPCDTEPLTPLSSRLKYFAAYVLTEAHPAAFLVALFPHQTQLLLSFALPNPILASSRVISMSLSCYLSLFCPFCTFAFHGWVHFPRSFIHIGLVASLLNFLLIEMDCSWASKRYPWISDTQPGPLFPP